MIYIHCHRDASHHRLHITGHAGYAPEGSDIVCAGVSALSMALLAYLQSLQVDTEDFLCRKGELKFRCESDDVIDTAMDVALTGYRILAGMYPEYVEVHN